MVRLQVNIDVDDLEKAIEFYRRARGLRLERRILDGTAAELGGASSPVYLLLRAAGSQPIAGLSMPREYRRHWTPVHLDVEVDDLDVAVRQARAAGAVLEGDPETHDWGRIAFMSDPFGHGFCLLQFTGAGYS